MGAARLQLDEPEAALGCFDQALAARPNDADFHTNKALTLLLMEDYERGWEEYEWRLKQRSVPPRLVPQPLWDGRLLPGGTILLYAEQGMGDTIQAVRYARLVKERVGTVLLECPAPLRGLLASCPGIDGVVDPESAAPAADVQLPLMSLMRIFGTRPGTIPAPGRAPHAPPSLARPANESRIVRVGIVWQGNPKLPGDMYRSVKLTRFAPLAAVPGVRLFSLQKGTGAEQLAALDGQFAVTDLASKIAADFRDTAAAIELLDLVIAVDTSVAHLAGALGRPVWLLLPYYPDWRWRRQGEDSPWYPTTRLFRQRQRGDWDGVFVDVAAALRQLAEEPQQETDEERIAAHMDALDAAGQLDGRALELARALVAARRRRLAIVGAP